MQARFSGDIKQHSIVLLDAQVALEQVSQQNASTSCKCALKITSRVNQAFYRFGTFLQQRSWLILCVWVATLCLSCIGLRGARVDTALDSWLEGRNAVLQTIQNAASVASYSTFDAILRQYPQLNATITSLLQSQQNAGGSSSSESSSGLDIFLQTIAQNAQVDTVLSQDAFQQHLNIMSTLVQLKITLFGEEWKFRDVCVLQEFPYIDSGQWGSLLPAELQPCMIFSPLNCFWEGSQLLGPFPSVSVPAIVQSSLSLPSYINWSNLNPMELMHELEMLSSLGIPASTLFSIRSQLNQMQITSGFVNKPCFSVGVDGCPSQNVVKNIQSFFDNVTYCTSISANMQNRSTQFLVGKSGEGAKSLQSAFRLTSASDLQQKLLGDDRVVQLVQSGLTWDAQKASQLLAAFRSAIAALINKSSSSLYSYNYFTDASLQVEYSKLSDTTNINNCLQLSLLCIFTIIIIVFVSVNIDDGVKSMCTVGVSMFLCCLLSTLASLALGAVAGLKIDAAILHLLVPVVVAIEAETVLMVVNEYRRLVNVEYASKMPKGDRRCAPDSYAADLLGHLLKCLATPLVLGQLDLLLGFLSLLLLQVSAVTNFCYQFALTATLNLVTHLSIVPILAYFDHRRLRQSRRDFFCCTKVTDCESELPATGSSLDDSVTYSNDSAHQVAVKMEDGSTPKLSEQKKPHRQSELRAWLASKFSNLLDSSSYRVIVCVFTLTLLIVSVYSLIAVKPNLQLNVQSFTPTGSATARFLAIEQRDFSIATAPISFLVLLNPTAPNISVDLLRQVSQFHSNYTAMLGTQLMLSAGPDWIAQFLDWIDVVQTGYRYFVAQHNYISVELVNGTWQLTVTNTAALILAISPADGADAQKVLLLSETYMDAYGWAQYAQTAFKLRTIELLKQAGVQVSNGWSFATVLQALYTKLNAKGTLTPQSFSQLFNQVFSLNNVLLEALTCWNTIEMEYVDYVAMPHFYPSLPDYDPSDFSTAYIATQPGLQYWLMPAFAFNFSSPNVLTSFLTETLACVNAFNSQSSQVQIMPLSPLFTTWSFYFNAFGQLGCFLLCFAACVSALFAALVMHYSFAMTLLQTIFVIVTSYGIINLAAVDLNYVTIFVMGVCTVLIAHYCNSYQLAFTFTNHNCELDKQQFKLFKRCHANAAETPNEASPELKHQPVHQHHVLALVVNRTAPGQICLLICILLQLISQYDVLTRCVVLPVVICTLVALFYVLCATPVICSMLPTISNSFTLLRITRPHQFVDYLDSLETDLRSQMANDLTVRANDTSSRSESRAPTLSVLCSCARGTRRSSSTDPLYYNSGSQESIEFDGSGSDDERSSSTEWYAPRGCNERYHVHATGGRCNCKYTRKQSRTSRKKALQLQLQQSKQARRHAAAVHQRNISSPLQIGTSCRSSLSTITEESASRQSHSPASAGSTASVNTARNTHELPNDATSTAHSQSSHQGVVNVHINVSIDMHDFNNASSTAPRVGVHSVSATQINATTV